MLRADTKPGKNRVTRRGGTLVAMARASQEGHFRPRPERNKSKPHVLFQPQKQHVQGPELGMCSSWRESKISVGRAETETARERAREMKSETCG